MQKPILFNTEMVQAIQAGRKTETRRLIKQKKRGYLIKPYEVGDVLYVRETWDFLPCIVCRPNSECCEIAPDAPDQMETADGLTDGCFLYKALDGDSPLAWEEAHKWRPSIHMPRQAARIFLRVTEVRSQYIQDITDREARAEGCGKPDVIYTNGALRCEFAELWDRTVPKGRLDRDGWAANPDVWVIRFERIEKPDGWSG